MLKPAAKSTEKPADPVVFVVDDDISVREALSSLIRSVGLKVETFSSAQEFLGRQRPEGPSCLVLDVRLPDQSGLALQNELAAIDNQIPIIFITAHGDIPMTVRAIKAGAVEFLAKPFSIKSCSARSIKRSNRMQKRENDSLRLLSSGTGITHSPNANERL